MENSQATPALPAFTQLRDLLAGAYQDIASSKVILTDANIDYSDISLNNSARLNWQMILEEVHARQQMDQLLVAVARDRPLFRDQLKHLADNHLQTLPLYKICEFFARHYATRQRQDAFLNRPEMENFRPSILHHLEGKEALNIAERWQSILDYAHEHDFVPLLLDLVRQEHPRSADEVGELLRGYQSNENDADIKQGNPLLSDLTWISSFFKRSTPHLHRRLTSIWTWICLWEAGALTAIWLGHRSEANCMSFTFNSPDGNLHTIFFGYLAEFNHGLFNLMVPLIIFAGGYTIKRAGRSLKELVKQRSLIMMEGNGVARREQVSKQLEHINSRSARVTWGLTALIIILMILGECISHKYIAFGWVQASHVISYNNTSILELHNQNKLRSFKNIPSQCITPSPDGSACIISKIEAGAHKHPVDFRAFLGVAMTLQIILVSFVCFIMSRLILFALIILGSLLAATRAAGPARRGLSQCRLMLKPAWDDAEGRLGLGSCDRVYNAGLFMASFVSVVIVLQTLSNSIKGAHARLEEIDYSYLWSISGQPILSWIMQIFLLVLLLAMTMGVPLIIFFRYADDERDRMRNKLYNMTQKARSYGLSQTAKRLEQRYAAVSKQKIWPTVTTGGLFLASIFVLLVPFIFSTNFVQGFVALQNRICSK